MKLLVIALTVLATVSSSSLNNSRHAPRLDPDEVLIEGDIVVKRRELTTYRVGVRSQRKIWPQKTLIYEISNKFSTRHRANILRAMDGITQRTGCIKFKRRDKERDYVNIKPARECSSYVGREGGSQGLRLTLGCSSSFQDITHELMHALGVEHEHSRYDRDQFINIHWKNIESDAHSEFELVRRKDYVHFRPFDFWSVMLYEPIAFAKRIGLTTISSRVAGQKVRYNSEKPVMSNGDVQTLKGLYKC